MNILPGVIECLKQAGSAIIDLCFPKSCAGCGRVDPRAPGFWCAQCREILGVIRSPICPCCGRPYPDSPGSADHLCGECLKAVFHFDAARSAVLHSGPVRERIHDFKFGRKLIWAPALVELMESTLRTWPIDLPQMIIPVPLHLKRLKERGFNQSGLLASGLARKLEIPVEFDALARAKWTEPQTRLNRSQRLTNVRGAFEAPHPEKVRNRSLLLIDDVFTTGETLSECARTLKRKGAARVYALTVTRALPD